MKDRRQGVRIRAIPGRDCAVLRIGEQEFEVDLKNESAHGYGVACPPGVTAIEGDSFVLGTLAGWHEVTVSRSDSTPRGVVLGLLRGREIPSPVRFGLGVSKLTIAAAAAIGLLSLPAASFVLGYWQTASPPTSPPNAASQPSASGPLQNSPRATPARP
jgi:hypothetical protein